MTRLHTRAATILLSLLLIGGICMGQSTPLTTTIEIFSSHPSSTKPLNPYLNGFRRSVSGQTIAYHSSHPDADNAMLVRARRDTQAISWETDTIPESSPGEFHEFIWLAGIECKGWGPTPPRKFRMYINDDLWFTCTNRKDDSARHWTVSGKHGSTLTFDSHLVDKHGDLFGYMYMRLAKMSVPAGAPLVVRVEGEDADSPDWFMTFTYPFNFIPRCRPEPAIIRGHDSPPTQELRISLDNLEPDRVVKISTSDQTSFTQPLAIGGNIIRVPVPFVRQNVPMQVTFTRDNVVIDQSTLTITPVKPLRIHLLPYSHNDIGYTDLQTVVERKHWAHLEEALRLIRETRDYPPDARYKWNMEVLWPLDSYLHQAPLEKKQELLDAIRNGSIGLNALYANPLTGLANSTEMSHYLDFARDFTRKYEIPIPTATVSDIPGFTWGIVTALAQSGVKHFSSGPNNGDRIGFVIEQWGDKPFYWLSQSGKDSVLFWVAGASYSSFHQTTLATAGPEKIMRLARKLDTYPFDMYCLPYTLGDNGGPDPTLSSFVKSWNEKYAAPELVIATHQQMFEEFEKKWGSTIPSMRGDFTPYWEDGALSSARETILARHAVDRLIQAETIWSMRTPASFPSARFDSAWRQVTLWDEHTWGADISVSSPDDPKTIGQWNIKQRFALQADSLSSALLADALGTPSKDQDDAAAFDVYNTSSWARTDLVILRATESAIGDRVQDDLGTTLLSQRLTTGELAVLVENIPPLASKRIVIRPGRSIIQGNARVTNRSLENAFLSLTIDDATGAISSLVDKTSDREFVDAAAGRGLNQYIYVPGKNPDSAQSLSAVRVRVKENGPLVASLLIEADAPGCDRFASEVRVIHGIHRVDIINSLTKTAIRSKEGVHFAFPFNIPDGTLQYDVASAIVRPEDDQLPGACKNFYSVVSWVDVSSDSSGITWTTPDAPLIEIGSITAEAPWIKTNKPSAHVFSYVMNNYWHTNYKADQEGPVRLRYSLFPHAQFNPSHATRLGHEHRRPLLVSPATRARTPVSSLFEIEPNTVVVESIKPLDLGRSWLLVLFNPSVESSDFQITWKRPETVTISLCDSHGDGGAIGENHFTMAPFATQFIRVNIGDK